MKSVLFKAKSVGAIGFFIFAIAASTTVAAEVDSSPHLPESWPLVIRKFDINSCLFKDRAKTFTSEDDLSERQMRALFAANGVIFPALDVSSESLSWGDAGKSFSYNDRAGVLWVRVAKEEIERIELAVRPFLRPPILFSVSDREPKMKEAPRIRVASRFLEFYELNFEIFGIHQPTYDLTGPPRIDCGNVTTNFELITVISAPLPASTIINNSLIFRTPP
jgi:hypothetical protein